MPETPSSSDGAMEFADKITFLEQTVTRLHALEKEQAGLIEEVRATFKVVFAFMSEPSALTPDWMKRIDGAIKSYEGQHAKQAAGEVTAVDYRILHQAGIR